MFVDYQAAVRDPVVLRESLAHVARFGFGLLENVPCGPGMILDVVGLFVDVRNADYGPLIDVRVEPNPANLAFWHRSSMYMEAAPVPERGWLPIDRSVGSEND